MAQIRALRPASAGTPTRSPARQALAAAISRLADLDREAAAIAKASDTVWAKLTPALAAVEAAEAAIDTAKALAADRIVAEALGTPGERPMSLKEAHAAHQAAVDEHEAYRAARTTLEAKARAVDNIAAVVRLDVRDRVKAVIASEAVDAAQRLAGEYATLHRELVDRRRALDWLESNGAVPAASRWRDEQHWPDLAGASPWQAWAQALALDADAPLPGAAAAPGSAA